MGPIERKLVLPSFRFLFSKLIFQIFELSILLFKGLPLFGFLIFLFKNVPTPLCLSRHKIKRHSGKNVTVTPTKSLPKKQDYSPIIFQITLSTYKLDSFFKNKKTDELYVGQWEVLAFWDLYMCLAMLIFVLFFIFYFLICTKDGSFSSFGVQCVHRKQMNCMWVSGRFQLFGICIYTTI